MVGTGRILHGIDKEAARHNRPGGLVVSCRKSWK